MPGEFVAVREFDSFVDSVRGDFRLLSDQVKEVGTKLDILMTTRIDEARLIGEMTGSIRSINERLDRHEKDYTNVTSDVDKLRGDHEAAVKNKLGLFWQLIVLVCAAAAGAFFTRRL